MNIKLTPSELAQLEQAIDNTMHTIQANRARMSMQQLEQVQQVEQLYEVAVKPVKKTAPKKDGKPMENIQE